MTPLANQLGKRMKGEGTFSDLLATRFKVACKKYKLNQSPSPLLTTELFLKKETTKPQLEFKLE